GIGFVSSGQVRVRARVACGITAAIRGRHAARIRTKSQGAANRAEGERAMNAHGYTYEGAREASERVHWKVEDLIGGDKHLDFSKPFQPAYFARVESLTFLSPSERPALNQIRGLGSPYTFRLGADVD